MGKLTIDEIIGHCERKTEQYERFYKREYLEAMPLTSSVIKEYWEHRQVAKYLRKLKDYENLEEQGRLVKLPCKVGDDVYYILGIPNKMLCTIDKCVFELSDINKIDKTLFLTREKAEAKLKELRGNND
nr:MAG TPA: hypothetical protein [Bacteriophage sp.]